MVFQQKLLEKAYFIAKMSGPAGQFRLLESALSVGLRKVSGIPLWKTFRT